jgi:ribonuclease inhibitor
MNDLFDQLSTGIPLPAHFGRNLDALWDILSSDIEGPFEIIWKHAANSKKLMAKDFDRAVKLFKALEKERGDFQLKIEK